MRLFFLFGAVVLFAAYRPFHRPQKATLSWETGRDLKTPESVIFHEAGKVLYVANINGKPTAKDGNGFISKLTLEGKIETLQWAKGLNAPKGMGIVGNSLFVTDIDRLCEIDLKTGEIIQTIPVDGAQFLNDIAVDEGGKVYFTDMQAGKIHCYAAGKVSLFQEGEDLSNPNGLYVKENKLIVGMNNRIVAYDLETKSMKEVVAGFGFRVDGLESDGHNGYVFSDWSGGVYYWGPDRDVKTLLNHADEKINAADIEYIPEMQLLLVPTFFDNRVRAYHLD